jgi:DnaK suppressor protein
VAGKKSKSSAGGGKRPVKKQAANSNKRPNSVKKKPASKKKSVGKKSVDQSKTTRTGADGRSAVKNRKASGASAAKRTGGNRLNRLASTSGMGKADETPRRRHRKTWLKKKELRHFEQLLLEKRAELVGNMEGMSREALSKNRSESAGDVSSMPTHMADVGSDNWEQEFTLELMAAERNIIREIDEALQRIEDRTYGICLATGEPISITRLEAKPWAKYTIEYARKRELGLVP